MDNDNLFLTCAGKTFNLSDRTHIMGILNITPDSFYDGGRYNNIEKAVERALEMIDAGADFIDIGGESSRPGAEPVSIDEEISRVVPVITALKEKRDVPISIDSVKSEVVQAALAAGAAIINDISGLRFDPKMAAVAAKADIPVILMHMSGKPKTMQKHPLHGDIISQIIEELQKSVDIAIAAGIKPGKIILDPGVGFGKKKPDNFLIIKQLSEIAVLGFPILMGVSRKSFIGWALDLPEEKRLTGTVAANVACIMNGAHILRVHDVRACFEAALIADRIQKADRA